MAQILYNQAGSPTVSGSAVFTDISKGKWYYNAVQWAAQQGYVAGMGNNQFDPNNNITREQLAMILYNHAGKEAVSGSFSGFADSENVSGWAKTAMLWATQNGIISGSKDGDTLYLNPKGNTTRAEAATMMKSYVDRN